VNGTNVNATKETGEPAHAGNAGGKSVWYSWTAPSTGSATFDTGQGDFDTLLAVYTGTSVSGLTGVASNDDYQDSGASRVTFSATAGVVYKIAVDGYAGDVGAVVLHWALVAPSGANDNFANRQGLIGPAGTVIGSTQGATIETNEPYHAGFGGGASVWYSWTPANSGAVVIDTLTSDFDTLLAVYTGTSLSGLSAVASNDDVNDTTRQSSITFRVVAGTTYQIAVDGYGAETGNVRLHWRLADLPRDFNADASPDIVWQNNSTGQRTIWYMNNTSAFAERVLPTVSTPWQIATTGDFNSDGQVDIVWQNTATGQRTVWFMNGATWIGEQPLPTVATTWNIAGANDFNGDGQMDILWQNTATGQRSIWFMSGTTWIGERALPTVAPTWEIVGTGDFNRDGHPDILWQNRSSGQRTIWLMNGATWVAERLLGTVPGQWTIAGAGDFNKDRNVDIVWQNLQTGQRSIWLLNNGAWTGQEAALPLVATTWEMRIH
jgi:hypothetical protein